MCQAAAALKNLVVIDNSLGDIIVPVLMSALDPSAVNQSHQAPVAMHTLNQLFAPLLYPRPIILKYLPSLLKVTLFILKIINTNLVAYLLFYVLD